MSTGIEVHVVYNYFDGIKIWWHWKQFFKRAEFISMTIRRQHFSAFLTTVNRPVGEIACRQISMSTNCIFRNFSIGLIDSEPLVGVSVKNEGMFAQKFYRLLYQFAFSLSLFFLVGGNATSIQNSSRLVSKAKARSHFVCIKFYQKKNENSFCVGTIFALSSLCRKHKQKLVQIICS